MCISKILEVPFPLDVSPWPRPLSSLPYFLASILPVHPNLASSHIKWHGSRARSQSPGLIPSIKEKK